VKTLYRKNHNGSIQQWTIWTEGATIVTEYGQVGGKLQLTKDTLAEGKNEGKANATSSIEQAEKECKAKWTKQLRMGYVDSMKAAELEEVDDVVEGGIYPMLAPSKIYPHFAKKLAFPLITQPKLDGSRLIAILKDGVCTLWSRTRKQVHSLPHIAKAVEEYFGNFVENITLDGEAWSKDVALSEGFEGLMSLIRKDEPAEGHEEIGYYIYDLPDDTLKNNKRDKLRLELLKDCKWPLVSVESTVCNNHAEVMEQHDRNMAEGYEGTMLRGDGPYEYDKRSYYLQKLKNREDAEFEIAGAEEGRGKEVGIVSKFVCITAEGKEFRSPINATHARRKELFNNPKEWKGFKLTVSYQGFTKDGIPRFPKGKALRKGCE
jgi:ATP-dependent DNA ligase